MQKEIKHRHIHLLFLLYCVCIASFCIVRAAVADDVPSFDVTRTCRAGQSISTTVDPFETCMQKEKEARDALKARWKQFRQEDKARCVELCNCGGVAGSYIELLTCLEMSPGSEKVLPKAPPASPDNN